MTHNWNYRLYSTSMIVIYPIQSASFFQSQEGWERYITIGFVAIAALILNRGLLKDLEMIFKSTDSAKKLYAEYIWIFFSALLNIFIFACIYHMYGITYNGNLVVGDWYNSIYFSIVTWTTLGYGDFSPPEALRMVAAFEAIVGYLYMAILVGLLLKISQCKSANESASK